MEWEITHSVLVSGQGRFPIFTPWDISPDILLKSDTLSWAPYHFVFWISWVPSGRTEKNPTLHLQAMCSQGVSLTSLSLFPHLRNGYNTTHASGLWWQLIDIIHTEYPHTTSAWEMGVNNMNTSTTYPRSLNIDPAKAWCGGKTRF